MMVRIGVIGAGAVGLSAAINVQRLMPDAVVTVIADKFGKDTTSNGAGGFFRPYLPHFAAMDQQLVRQWLTDSWNFYNGLANSPLTQETGHTFVTGTVAYTTPQDEQYKLIAEMTYDFHQLSPETIRKMNLQRYPYCYSFTTVITQSDVYLNWLMKQFREAGGKIERKTVQSLCDLYGEYDVVVNCCGLGADKLLKDKTMYPVRGHLVQVHAPWMKNFFLSEDDVYFIPHNNKLHVGGVRQKGNWSMTPDPETRHHILSRAEELFPQLKGAKVLGEWIGLRPGRNKVRCESEIVNCKGKGKLQVVHNYGHEGHGITLSWGSGITTAKMVQDFVQGIKSRL